MTYEEFCKQGSFSLEDLLAFAYGNLVDDRPGVEDVEVPEPKRHQYPEQSGKEGGDEGVLDRIPENRVIKSLYHPFDGHIPDDGEDRVDDQQEKKGDKEDLPDTHLTHTAPSHTG